MEMNKDEAWLRHQAESEDGCDVSVGGPAPYIKLKPVPLSTAGITLHWDDGGPTPFLPMEQPMEWKGSIGRDIFDGTWRDHDEDVTRKTVDEAADKLTGAPK